MDARVEIDDQREPCRAARMTAGAWLTKQPLTALRNEISDEAVLVRERIISTSYAKKQLRVTAAGMRAVARKLLCRYHAFPYQDAKLREVRISEEEDIFVYELKPGVVVDHTVKISSTSILGTINGEMC